MGHTAVARMASGHAAVQRRTGAMTPEHGWHMVPAGARESTQAAVRSGTYRSAPTLAQQAAPQSAPALQLGPLERFARDGTVTDVVVTCDGAVWIDCGRGMQLAHTAIPLHDPHVLRDFAVRLCAQLGCRLDESQPIADASAPDGMRVHAVVAPIVPHGASVSIRFPDRVAPDLDVLARLGMCPAPWVPLLRLLVQGRANVLISGGTGVGKTTLLKALLACCRPEERIVTVEEVRELHAVPHAHTVSLVARAANVEGKGAVGLPDLVKATLRMRPDRVVVGECRSVAGVEFGAPWVVHHGARGFRVARAGAAHRLGSACGARAARDGDVGGRRVRRAAASGTWLAMPAHRADRHGAMRGWPPVWARGGAVEWHGRRGGRRGVE